jgi:hypothetical protein
MKRTLSLAICLSVGLWLSCAAASAQSGAERTGQDQTDLGNEPDARPRPPPRKPGGFGAIEDQMSDRPKAPPASKPAPVPEPTPGPAPNLVTQTATFAALPNCAKGLAALPYGTIDQTIAYLDRRIEFWKSHNLKTISPFQGLTQAEFVKSCLEQRFALLQSYAPDDEMRRAARKTIDEFRVRWGGKIEEFFSGDVAEVTTMSWWENADAAFENLVRVEQAIESAPPVEDLERDKLVTQAKVELAKFVKSVEVVSAKFNSLPADKKPIWLQVIAYKARNAGLAIDTLQRRDFDKDASSAYAILMSHVPNRIPTPEGILAGDLAPVLDHARQLRSSQVVLDPGAQRDMSAQAQIRNILEDLYMINYRSQTIGLEYQRSLRGQAQEYRDYLRSRYELDSQRGRDPNENRAARQKEWEQFLADLRKERAAAQEGFTTEMKLERKGIIAHGVYFSKYARNTK